MSKTKISGYLLIAAAVLNTAIDAINGSGFDLGQHLNDLVIALNGAGFVFLRDAVSKVQDVLKK